MENRAKDVALKKEFVAPKDTNATRKLLTEKLLFVVVKKREGGFLSGKTSA
jgi:hypothetical protein